ncbi:hypothetical protein HHK36_029904 [Tetracentron sinense]|uniref:Large ribosomal subunit protein uL15/eL18 domain-containing protein n=1 Tax=Tetracentron sinense TaxID=13715 RepID=A0A834YC65_TETSI|nr:hypothetical protein HHK36_029904 [Tetracentron sinense]
MTTCFKKNRKKRGHVSTDHGRVGKHRKHPEGHGNFYCPIINIDKLWSMIPQDIKDKASPDNVPCLDVTQFGYFKVLGKGILPSTQPIVVKAKIVSKTAEKKIKEAGGAVLLTA